jgi:hypothetical protein
MPSSCDVGESDNVSLTVAPSDSPNDEAYSP